MTGRELIEGILFNMTNLDKDVQLLDTRTNAGYPIDDLNASHNGTLYIDFESDEDDE